MHSHVLVFVFFNSIFYHTKDVKNRIHFIGQLKLLIIFTGNTKKNSECLTTLTYLLEENANLEAQTKIGRTLLHYASENSLLEVVKLLVEEKQMSNLQIIIYNTFQQNFKLSNEIIAVGNCDIGIYNCSNAISQKLKF